jgi:hypothetical protein
VVIGIALSYYVARIDYQKRQAGVRTRAQYRVSLVVVPAVLGGVGALVGTAIAHL